MVLDNIVMKRKAELTSLKSARSREMSSIYIGADTLRAAKYLAAAWNMSFSAFVEDCLLVRLSMVKADVQKTTRKPR